MFRSPLLASGDDHGVSDLLREVAKRNNSSLTDEERKEVNAMVKRVEEHKARGTPMGKLKKKIKNVTKVSAETDETSGSGNGDNDNESHRSSPTTSTSESVNKWGKDLVQKFSNMQTTIPNPLKDEAATASSASSHTSKLDPKDVFRNFAIKLKSKEPTAANKEKAKRLEAMKEAFERSSREAFERSSQSGRDLLQNFSKNFENFQNSLSSNLSSSQQQQPPTAELDKTSAEYKLDVKGIALLKEIFPDESTENLIKMHFGHLQSGKKR